VFRDTTLTQPSFAALLLEPFLNLSFFLLVLPCRLSLTTASVDTYVGEKGAELVVSCFEMFGTGETRR